MCGRVVDVTSAIIPTSRLLFDISFRMMLPVFSAARTELCVYKHHLPLTRRAHSGCAARCALTVTCRHYHKPPWLTLRRGVLTSCDICWRRSRVSPHHRISYAHRSRDNAAANHHSFASYKRLYLTAMYAPALVTRSRRRSTRYIAALCWLTFLTTMR